MEVSVIITVYHEAASIGRLLSSLATQTRAPDEIVICDGGSRDGTVDEIMAWSRNSYVPVRVIVEPQANISRGRNVAIAAAKGPLIAATDAGVRLDPSWLESLVAPWESNGKTQAPIASAGFFLPDVEGPFQCAMAATVLPLFADIDPECFLPSSRSVAFTKDAWAAAGGYPEWLDYCEDILFDLAIKRLGNQREPAFRWSPTALVFFRPRTTLPSFWTQYYRYARGDGKANLFLKRHIVRYMTYLVVLPLCVGYGIFGVWGRWLGWAALAAGVVAYCWRPWQRLTEVGRSLTPIERITAGVWIPVIRAVGDFAKMVGYPVGVWWRFRNRKGIVTSGHRGELQK